jgi:hypothetical protein
MANIQPTIHSSATKGRVAFAILLALTVFSMPDVRAASPAPGQSAPSATFTIDRVSVTITTRFLPSETFLTAEDGASNQVASSVARSPYRELQLTAVPFGTSPPAERLPAAQPGGAQPYRQALANDRQADGQKVEAAPPIQAFGQRVPGTLTTANLHLDSATPKRAAIAEWVVESGPRLWIARAALELSDGQDASDLAQNVADLALSTQSAANATTLPSRPSQTAPPRSAADPAARPTSSPSDVTSTNSLQPGQTLHAGQHLTSSNNQYTVEMQADGNLVLYGQGQALWASWTEGNPGAWVAMQSDGNLVVYASSGRPLWATMSLAGTNLGYYLTIQVNGNAVIYTSSGQATWQTGVVNSSLAQGRFLRSDQYLTSGNGQYQLIMQSDGNLVQYFHKRALWNSSTWGNPGAYVAMQADGNLVVYASSGRPLWATMSLAGTNLAYSLQVQDDGNVVIYTANGRATWWSGIRNSVLAQDESLAAGQYVLSPNGYQLIMQADGNLVQYAGQYALWDSRTFGNPGAWVIMQTDGNLVVYSSSGQPLWSSRTNGTQNLGSYLSVQSDSNLVIYTGTGQAIWARFGLGPPWWSGDCDVNNNPGSYRLGGTFAGIAACGPRPLFGGGDNLVRFFPGAVGDYEWECVELSARYLYLHYNQAPYIANGSQVVWNYPGSRLRKVSNGTAGAAPVAGDVLSYGATSTNGHTSVVAGSSVDGSGNGSIDVIEENNSPGGSARLSVSGWWVNSNLSVTGWLHN